MTESSTNQNFEEVKQLRANLFGPSNFALGYTMKRCAPEQSTSSQQSQQEGFQASPTFNGLLEEIFRKQDNVISKTQILEADDDILFKGLDDLTDELTEELKEPAGGKMEVIDMIDELNLVNRRTSWISSEEKHEVNLKRQISFAGLNTAEQTSTMADKIFIKESDANQESQNKGEQIGRNRLISNVTEQQTLGSTQHSDCHSPCLTEQKINKEKQQENDTIDTSHPKARPRVVSGLSSYDYNNINFCKEVNSDSDSRSNESSNLNIAMPNFADKVRNFTFQGDVEDLQEEVKGGQHFKYTDMPQQNNVNSPINANRQQNRRSQSQNRPPQNLTWSQSNFDSSSNTCSTNQVPLDSPISCVNSEFEQVQDDKLNCQDHQQIVESNKNSSMINFKRFELSNDIITQKSNRQQPRDLVTWKRESLYQKSHGFSLKREDLTQGEQIGSGSYGMVHKVKFQDRNLEVKINPQSYKKAGIYALKELSEHKYLKEGRLKEVFIERCVLSNLKHPSIIKLYQSFKQKRKFYLLIEHCPRGSLQQFMKRETRISPPLVKHITAEIVNALAYLREIKILHRDLKPGNIVLDGNFHIKLIDFGTCKVFNEKIQAIIVAFQSLNDKQDGQEVQGVDQGIPLNRVNSLVGTEEYLAPETLKDQGLSYACDYWSLGIILYELIYGVTPYKGKNDVETFQNIQRFTEIQFPENPPNIDPQAKSLIQLLLVKDPSLRLGFNSIDEIKNHAYFAEVDWKTIRKTKVPYQPPQVPKLHIPKPASANNLIGRINRTPLISPLGSNTSQKSPQPRSTETKLVISAALPVPSFVTQQPQQQFTATPPCSQSSEPEQHQQPPSQSSKILIKGILRKKGIIMNNERYVIINGAGIFVYYHFDKPLEHKGNIDLRSDQVTLIRFTYINEHERRLEDSFRIETRGETFIFRASKQMAAVSTTSQHPSLQQWETVIRNLSDKVVTTYQQQ